jgi:hypothetical protein
MISPGSVLTLTPYGNGGWSLAAGRGATPMAAFTSTDEVLANLPAALHAAAYPAGSKPAAPASPQATVRDWLAQHATLTGDPNDRVTAAKLVAAFASTTTTQMADRSFSNAVATLAGTLRDPITGQTFARIKSGGVMLYTGLRLKTGGL